MSFAKQLQRLRSAAGQPSPSNRVTVRRDDLRELLLNFDGLDNEARFWAGRTREAIIPGMCIDDAEAMEQRELEDAIARLPY